ncbi:hypothetical protein GHK92_15130 [Nocardioides sp. dk4132]|uniref:hypothetical protein n=1 Tax=unclassified Nocardioides TaxID=2615069 RepID=UPI001297109A|nr:MULTISPECIES: hypothetical protein [unclassified Nocardioides]MQW77205.1 hypothetical protein [Nocardioides sp. dk4132]QGA07970.1 hypothetical protein GFH29_11610 [Nocardioides sp. dk884]
MSVQVGGLSVWLPGRGLAVSEVSLEVEGLTLLTGVSGCGTTTVLRAIAGRLPAGALVRGDLPGRREPGALVEALPGTELPDRAVHELLGSRPDQELVAELGLEDLLETPARSLDASRRAALGVAWVTGHPRAEVALVDQPLSRLHATHRAAVSAALRRLADRGTHVLWAEHVLEDAVALADRVVELVPGGAIASAAQSWMPRTLPAPPQLALARALGLPREEWADLARLGTRREVASASPRTAARRSPVGELLVAAPTDRTGLPHEVRVHHLETLGVVAAAGQEPRALDVARRLAALAGHGTRLPHPLVLPRGVPVGRIARLWAKRHATTAEGVLALAGRLVSLDPARTTTQHSDGERAALRWALSTLASGPNLLVHPDAGLDAGARRRLAGLLADEPRGTSVLLSRDPELLVRACHRLLVLGPGGQVADGTPVVVADRLPVAPVLRRAGARALRVRDVLGAPR